MHLLYPCSDDRISSAIDLHVDSCGMLANAWAAHSSPSLHSEAHARTRPRAGPKTSFSIFLLPLAPSSSDHTQRTGVADERHRRHGVTIHRPIQNPGPRPLPPGRGASSPGRVPRSLLPPAPPRRRPVPCGWIPSPPRHGLYPHPFRPCSV
jgi:hypothetical protein